MSNYTNNKADGEIMEAADLEAIETASATKANKIASPTTGNVIKQDASGDLVDTGHATPTGTFVGISDTQTLTNKTIGDTNTINAQDDAFTIDDATDATKQIDFNAAGTTGTKTTITSSQTTNKVITLPDATDTLTGKATTDTLTNKTIDLTSNTLTGTAAQFDTALSDDNFVVDSDIGVTVAAAGANSDITSLTQVVTFTDNPTVENITPVLKLKDTDTGRASTAYRAYYYATDSTNASSFLLGRNQASTTVYLINYEDNAHINFQTSAAGQVQANGNEIWDAGNLVIAIPVYADGAFLVGNGSSYVEESGATAQTSLGIITKYKTADESTSSDTTSSNDTHLAGWSLVANTYYKFEGLLYVSTASATPGFKFRFNESTAQQTSIMHTVYTSATGSTSGHLNGAYSQSPGEQLALAGGVNTIAISGFVLTNASTGPTVDYQWAQNVSSADATTVKQGSWITFTKMS